MAIKLNLLPPELAIDKKTGTFLKTLRSVNLIAVAVFLIFTLGISGYFIFTSILLRNKENTLEGLKSQIKTRQTSEQQIVLLKDRLKKISTAQKIANSTDNLAAVDPILSLLSPDSAVTEMDIDSSKIGLLISFKSTSDLTAFFDGLKKSTEFKSATLTSFGFNPTTGYLAGITVVPK